MALGATMTADAVPEREALATEAGRVLLFSKNFFESFRIKKDRLREWQFLALLLEKEHEGRADLRDLSFEDIERIAKRKLRSIHYWENRLIKGLRSPATPYLTPSEETRAQKVVQPKRRPTINIYTFNEDFDRAAARYISFFLNDILGLVPSDGQVEHLPPDKRRTLLKALFRIQYSDYWRAWDTFAAELGTVAKRYGIQPKHLIVELELRTTYWGLMLLGWKQHVSHPDEPFDLNDFHHAVFEVMPDTSPDDVKRSLKYLSARCQIFTLERADGRKLYKFNSAYDQAFFNYALVLRDTRLEMIRKLGAEFGIKAQ